MAALVRLEFFVSISGGVWASQAEMRNVLSSENMPSSKTSRNSQPSGARP